MLQPDANTRCGIRGGIRCSGWTGAPPSLQPGALERQTCSGKEDNAFTGDLKDYDDENLNDLKDTLDTTYRMKGNPEEETR